VRALEEIHAQLEDRNRCRRSGAVQR
jgi:hypothetical protein